MTENQNFECFVYYIIVWYKNQTENRIAELLTFRLLYMFSTKLKRISLTRKKLSCDKSLTEIQCLIV